MKNADMPSTSIFNAKGGVLDLTDGTIDSGYLSQNGRVFAIGLTKREAFAMAAMQGLLANRGIIDDHHSQSISWISNHAISQADAMLKELDK